MSDHVAQSKGRHRGSRSGIRRFKWIAAAGCLIAAACVPQIGSSSPYFGSGAVGLDGRSIGDMTACASGGGTVTAEVRGPFDIGSPYLVEIFRGVGTTDLLTSGYLSTYGDHVVSPPLGLGECFRVRFTKPTGGQGQFDFVVTWCTGDCTSVPVPPTIDAIATAGGPYTAPALVPFQWTVTDRNPDAVVTCRVDGDGDGTWDRTVVGCNHLHGANVLVGPGAHTAVLEASDGSFPPVTRTVAVNVGPDPVEPYNIEVREPSPLPPEVASLVPGVVAKWEQVITRGVPDQLVNVPAGYCGTGGQAVDQVVDDMVVDVVVGGIDGRGGLLGTAGGCAPGPDGLPRIGLIIIDSADIPFVSQQVLGDVIAHEFGHVLAFGVGPYFNYVSGMDTDNPTFTGPRARLEWLGLGGTGDPPLHPSNTVHWRDPQLAGELMNNSVGHALAILTAATLADVVYHVDPSAADPYHLP